MEQPCKKIRFRREIFLGRGTKFLSTFYYLLSRPIINEAKLCAPSYETKQEQTLLEDLRHGYVCRKKENLEKHEKLKKKVINSAKRSEIIFEA